MTRSTCEKGKAIRVITMPRPSPKRAPDAVFPGQYGRRGDGRHGKLLQGADALLKGDGYRFHGGRAKEQTDANETGDGGANIPRIA